MHTCPYFGHICVLRLPVTWNHRYIQNHLGTCWNLHQGCFCISILQRGSYVLNWACSLSYLHLIWRELKKRERTEKMLLRLGPNCSSFLNSSLGLAGEKHYQKITISIFRLVLQNFAIQGYFPYILFYCYLFSLLSSVWFVIAVCGSVSVRELVKS